MKMLDLFSGIGGFSLAAQWVWGDDLEIIAFVEIDHFCQKVLAKNFPGVTIYNDIKKIQWVVADSRREYSGSKTESESTSSNTPRCNGREYTRIPTVDLLTGGFPCQPFSCAGKRAGTEDDRHLWPEMLRAIREVKPRWCLLENVSGLLSIDGGVVFERVCIDLENEGYSVLPLIIPACGQGAPHRRDRIWIVGNSECRRKSPCRERVVRESFDQENSRRETAFTPRADRHAPDTDSGRCQQRDKSIGTVSEFNQGNPWKEHWYEIASRFCLLANGLPEDLARPGRKRNRVQKLKALGNSIVPQIAKQIFRAIKEVEQ